MNAVIDDPQVASSNNAVNAKIAIAADKLNRTVSLGDRSLTILDDVSLSVADGETLAIVGASGSGKTTLLGLLAGLDRPNAGSVSWHGETINTLSEDALAKKRQGTVGFVFQSFQLLPALTALENVMLPLELANNSDAESRAKEWLGRMGLGERIDHLPRQLSGGEQQRVAIARAFSASPSIVFADEPTGNLDTDTGNEIIELMFKLNRDEKTTLILVTHDLDLAARCNRQIRLARGRVVPSPLEGEGARRAGEGDVEKTVSSELGTSPSVSLRSSLPSVETATSLRPAPSAGPVGARHPLPSRERGAEL